MSVTGEDGAEAPSAAHSRLSVRLDVNRAHPGEIIAEAARHPGPEVVHVASERDLIRHATRPFENHDDLLAQAVQLTKGMPPSQLMTLRRAMCSAYLGTAY